MDIEKFLKHAMIQMELEQDSYLHSFVREDGFRGKRFMRYVGKVKDGLFSFVRNYTPHFDVIYNHGEMKTTDILDYFYANLLIFSQCVNNEMSHLRPLLFFFQLPEVPSIMLDGNEELIDDLLSQTNVIYPMIDKEIENTCLEHLAYLSGKDEDITEINYVKQTLPFDTTDNLKLLNDIFFRIIICFEHWIVIRHDYSSELGEKVLNVHKQLDELQDNMMEIESEVREKNILIEKLKKQMEDEREKNRNLINRTTESLREEIRELKKENITLKEKMEKPSEKMEEEIVCTREEKKEETREIRERMLFIISERCTFLKELQTAFPTAKITFKNYSQSIGKSDVVIIFTPYVNHTTYYDVKEICKRTNTKLLHCNHSNIEKIKEMILENM